MEPFIVTAAAAEEIRRSMAVGDADGMGLRVAARAMADGGLDYSMGFDERAPGDLVVACRGIDVLIADQHRTLLAGTTLDYVELEPGQFRFIFVNPNDPHHTPPADC